MTALTLLTPRTPGRLPRRHVLVLVASVALLALVPLLFNPHFYFYADTAEGAFGSWYETGQQLRGGTWPVLLPEAWMAGNLPVEGQWGLWNPAILLISLWTSLMPNAALAVTPVKIIAMVIGAWGFASMAAALGARPTWAVVAGQASAFAGFTLFMDATGWVTNLFVWCAFPWAYLAFTAYARRDCTILRPAIISYLLITVGYVHGTIMLALMIFTLLAHELIRRRTSGALRILTAGVAAGLVAVAVHLPSVLGSGVTTREDLVRNSWFMVLDLSGLATSMSPVSQGRMTSFWGETVPMPMLYIAWFLPLLALLPWRRLVLPDAVRPVLALTVVTLLYATAPSEIGPLRFPVRAMPWLASLVIVVLVVALSHREGPRRTGELVRALGLSAASTWFVWAALPEGWKWPALALALTSAGLASVWWLLDGAAGSHRRAAAVALTVSALVVVLQSVRFAPVVESAADYPGDTSEYSQALDGLEGDGIIVGDPRLLRDEMFPGLSFGNLWYLEDEVAIQNTYTPVGFEAYSEDLCIGHDGRTCAGLVERLFSVDESTGELVADLLSLDVIVLVDDPATPSQEGESLAVPAGWSLARATETAVVWERDAPTPPVGGPVWSSEGTSVALVDQSDTEVVLDVASPDGGEVVLSRLAWPGYSAEGAGLGEPLRDYLLTLDVAPGTDGEVRVSFRPEGWTLVIGSLAASALMAVAIGAWELRGRARRGAESPVPERV